MNERLSRAVTIARATAREVSDDDVSGLSAELAYRFFLALFPFFVFLGALAGLIATAAHVANPTDRIMDALGSSLPSDASSVLRGQLRAVLESRNVRLLSVGIIGAVWAASAGMATLMKALNRTHHVPETRPWWKKYGIAVGLTVLAGSFLVAAFVVLFAGQVYGREIADKAGLSGPFGLFLRYARWPVVVALLLVAVAFLYWAAPNVRRPIKWISPGAVLFTVVWLVATYLFGLYVSNFGAYNKTYGALGGVVIVLVWFYLTAFILLLGEELNAVLDRQAATGGRAPGGREADADADRGRAGGDGGRRR